MTRIHARKLATVGAAIGIVLAWSISADAQDRVRWKMQSAFASSLPHLGTAGVRFTKNIERVSGGNFKIKFYEPGALVPGARMLRCRVQGLGGSPAGPRPATTPARSRRWRSSPRCRSARSTASSSPGRSSAAATSSRTRSTASTAYTRSTCFAIGPETSGWFREPVKSLDQLKGLRMRFFGLGAQVMTKLGVSTQLLAAADIYPALERGVIDATEFSMPDIDIDLGFYQVAKNNYFPGLASAGLGQRTADEQGGLGGAARPVQGHDRARARGEHPLHLRRDRGDEPQCHERDASRSTASPTGAGRTRSWPPSRRRGWRCWPEQSAKDPIFKKVADSYLAFREKYKPWGDAQFLKPHVSGPVSGA